MSSAERTPGMSGAVPWSRSSSHVATRSSGSRPINRGATVRSVSSGARSNAPYESESNCPRPWAPSASVIFTSVLVVYGAGRWAVYA